MVPWPQHDDLDCGGCGIPECPYCGRDPDTVDLVAAYVAGWLYQAAPTGIGAHDPEFWAGLRAHPPQPFALVELLNVPRDLASRLTAQGTDEQTFVTGALASAAATPYLGRRIYTHPSYTGGTPATQDPIPLSTRSTGRSLPLAKVPTMSTPFPGIPVDAFTDPVRHFPFADVGALAEASAVRVVYILAAFGFLAQAQPLGSSWSVCTRATDAAAARGLLDELGLTAWPCKPLVAEAGNAPPRFGVWTTLDSGRFVKGADDVRQLLERDPRSVFLNPLLGAPNLPDDGRVESLPTNALLVLYGVSGRRDPWTAVLHRSKAGFMVSSSDAPDVLAELAPSWTAA
jgi:hypothetical protein